ncbi:MFS transporter [Ammoniphilus sp. 3BR4]|uniref:MFS transporter n=1 Tax=Ammoniphilus sp. 3BR4 TaxID=3158265 RepID=UPI00346693D4
MSCLGGGSLLGAIYMSLRGNKLAGSSFSIVCCVSISIFLVLNGMSNSFFVSGLFLAISGFLNIIFMIHCNSSLQLHSCEEYRARVMSVYSLVFQGSTPVGSLITGYIADRYGADGAFIGNGFLIILPFVIVLLLFHRKKTEAKEQLVS